ncbi:MAG: hypothetical protein ACRCYU_09310 [Nocardioides sp.]
MTSTPIMNPSLVAPIWWDRTWEDGTEPEWRFGAPMPGSLLPCGCHLRRPDYEAVLCPGHLNELNGNDAAGVVTEISRAAES